MSFTILHILVINAAKDMVIMAAISITTVMAYYGHKGLNGFKCCMNYNLSSGSCSCISSNDRNGNYDVLELITKNVGNGPNSCNGHIGCYGYNGLTATILQQL